MKSITTILAISLLTAASWALPGETVQVAKGETVQIVGANTERSEDGQGRNFAVAGANNKLTIRGQANEISVSGSGNIVTVEQVNVVNISGMGNKVFYSKGTPQINRSGVNNEVVQH